MTKERNEEIDELLNAYLDGELGDADRTALEGRLKHDSQLERELESLGRIDVSLERHYALDRSRAESVGGAGVGTTDVVQSAMAQASIVARDRFAYGGLRWSVAISGALAASLLLMGLGYWLGNAMVEPTADRLVQRDSTDWKVSASLGGRTVGSIVSGRVNLEGGTRLEVTRDGYGCLRLHSDARVQLASVPKLESGTIWLRSQESTVQLNVDRAVLTFDARTEATVHFGGSFLSVATLEGQVVVTNGETSSIVGAREAGHGRLDEPIATYDVVFAEKHRTWTWPLVLANSSPETGNEARGRVAELVELLAHERIGRMASTILRQDVGPICVPQLISYLERPEFALTVDSRERAIEILGHFVSSASDPDAPLLAPTDVERLFELARNTPTAEAVAWIELLYWASEVDMPSDVKRALAPDAPPDAFRPQIEKWRDLWRRQAER